MRKCIHIDCIRYVSACKHICTTFNNMVWMILMKYLNKLFIIIKSKLYCEQWHRRHRQQRSMSIFVLYISTSIWEGNPINRYYHRITLERYAIHKQSWNKHKNRKHKTDTGPISSRAIRSYHDKRKHAVALQKYSSFISKNARLQSP